MAPSRHRPIRIATTTPLPRRSGPPRCNRSVRPTQRILPMSIKKHSRPLMLTAAVLSLLTTLPALAAECDKSKIKGLITTIQGDTITIKDVNNAEQTITVSPSTTYKRTKGLTGVVHEKAEQTALMSGLPISADVTAAGTGFNATE